VDWKVLIIGLIPLGVWILSTIFRGIEDAREQEKQPRPAPGERPVKAPRRPSSELDRFLDEARRRREVSPKRRAEPEPVLEALPVAKPPEPPPPPRVEKRAPSPSKARETRKAEPPPPVVVLPVELPPPPPAPARLPPRSQPSPALAKVVGMLRDRNAVAMAVALREILDRPLSQRRGG
jgi:hypothetical protein